MQNQSPVVAMTYRTALTALVDLFESAGLRNGRRQAEGILEDVCRASRARLFGYPDTPVDESEWARCQALAQRRLAGEPIQYVLGYAEFCGLRLRVTPDVLVPRPETEQLVELTERLLSGIESPRVLDVGTGSGCIPLALVSRSPRVRAWGCDVDPAALRIAWQNRGRLNLPLSLYQTDALKAGFARAFTGSLDAIISNPPYVPRSEEESLPIEVRQFEPHHALFPPVEPLAFYRSISREAAAVLRPGGVLCFEVHEEQGHEVPAILQQFGFVDVVPSADYAGRLRFVHARQPVGHSA